MLILCIDTATTRVGVALATEHGVVGSVELDRADPGAPLRHAEQLAPAIEYLVEQTGLELAHCSAVAVDVGPGLFTGLRVGVTTARVIAQVLHVPVIGIPSLDLLAYPLRYASALVVPVLDARRHEVFYALYRPVPGGLQRESEYRVGPPSDLVAELEARGEDALLSGDGARRFADELTGLEGVTIASPTRAFPSLVALGELAAARFEREEFAAPTEVAPLYLRRSDAEINWERRAS